MKTKNILTLTAVAFLLIGFLSSCNAFAEKIKGSGNVISQERKIESFTQIKMNGVFNVMISQGEKESLTIEADDNLVDLVETRNEGNVLIIKQKKDCQMKPTKYNLYITVKDLQKIETSSVGNIVSNTPLTLGDFELSSSSVGNIKLDLNCTKFSANITSVGDLNLKGKVTEAVINNSSVGNIYAVEFISEKLTLNNSGVGDVEVYAENEISLISSGVGNVAYKGNAVVKVLENKGVGKVTKI